MGAFRSSFTLLLCAFAMDLHSQQPSGPPGFTVSGGQAVRAASAGGPYIIATVAGGQLPPAVPMPATAASVQIYSGLAIDRSGNVYFSSPPLNVVFKVDTNGTLTRVAGSGTPGYAGDGGSALSAQLNDPQGLAVDSTGNLYIADLGNSRVRKVAPNGIISTVAGSGTCCFSGDGGPAISAQINPNLLACDAFGNLFIATYDLRIRKVASSGIITTVAGNGSYGFSGDGGPATSAQFGNLQGLAVDATGHLYIADESNQRIRKVGKDGVITTVAGNGTSGFSGDGGPATAANLWYPHGLAVDPSGNNLYIADSDNNRIRKVSADGSITTFAGTGVSGYSGDGGAATNAVFASPAGVALAPSGALMIVDADNFRIRTVSGGGIVNTLAGGGSGDGRAIFAGLVWPSFLSRDQAGNIYFSEYLRNRVRKIGVDGMVTTVAGTGSAGFSGDGGPATAAQLSNPEGITIDGLGNLYIADMDNNRIRKVATNGTITTVAGNGNCCFSGDEGPATSAQLGHPYALAVDTSGNLYVSDTTSRVRRVATNGAITTVAGNGGEGFSGDGGQAINAQLAGPAALAVDGYGNLYIADTPNDRVRKVATNGTITTVAGNGGEGFSGDGGQATSAQLKIPQGVAVDGSGNLFIADSGNYRIRSVDVSGIIRSVAGNGSIGYSGDGGPALNASLLPFGILVDPDGKIYIADSSNDAIRVLVPAGLQAVLTVRVTHGSVQPGQNGATYTVTISNAASAGPSSGLVTFAAQLPTGLTLVSASGTGWTCSSSGATCTRSDPLAAGASYPPIQLTVNVASTASLQLTAQFSVSGGGAIPAGASDFTAGTPSASGFVPVTPCRIADTRNPNGTFGGPILQGGGTRTFPIPQSACNIPASASAYSVNLTVVPWGPLTYLTTWPTGLAKPLVSTLNSWEGRIVANAAIVPAGANGGIDIYVWDTTHLVIDINGYFDPTAAAAMPFYALAPCRMADTRNPAGPLGGPSLAAGQARGFPLTTSSCGIPSSAQALSVNATVVPATASLGYLTLWPTGAQQPYVSTLNSPDGRIIANAALTPLGGGAPGSLSAYATDATALVLDVNGYFSPSGSTSGTPLSFYPLTPCRIADTRDAAGSFGGPSLAAGKWRSFPVTQSACNVPTNAQAFSLNVTVVPQGPLGYLTIWPSDRAQPFVSTLNSPRGSVVANAAIVPASADGAVSVYATDATDVVLDINGYFAP